MFEYTAFRSPTGNVGCMIDTDYVPGATSSTTNGHLRPGPRTASSTTGRASRSLRASRLSSCVPATPAPDARPLPYGESITAGPMSCESAESGITCRDAESGTGFTISREAYTLF